MKLIINDKDSKTKVVPVYRDCMVPIVPAAMGQYKY